MAGAGERLAKTLRVRCDSFTANLAKEQEAAGEHGHAGQTHDNRKTVVAQMLVGPGILTQLLLGTVVRHKTAKDKGCTAQKQHEDWPDQAGGTALLWRACHGLQHGQAFLLLFCERRPGWCIHDMCR